MRTVQYLAMRLGQEEIAHNNLRNGISSIIAQWETPADVSVPTPFELGKTVGIDLGVDAVLDDLRDLIKEKE